MLADFVPTLPVLAAYTVASIILGLTPGPDMTLFLSKTVSQSRAAGLAAFGGATTGLVVHSVLIAAGLSVLLAASVTAFTILKVVGARSISPISPSTRSAMVPLCRSTDEAGRNGSARSTSRDCWSTCSIPKIIVFFVTFLPQFVSPTDPEAAKKLLFLGLFFAVVNIPVCVGLILFADRIASFLRRSPKATRMVDWLFAAVLGAFAVRLVLAQSR